MHSRSHIRIYSSQILDLITDKVVELPTYPVERRMQEGHRIPMPEVYKLDLMVVGKSLSSRQLERSELMWISQYAIGTHARLRFDITSSV